MSAQSRAAYEVALADRDAAELLYEHGIGGLFVTAVAGTGFVLMLLNGEAAGGALTWLSIMLMSIGVRAFNLVSGRKRRMAGDWDGRAEIKRFGRGVLLTATVWAVFPLMFFHELNGVERTTMAIIVSAMAGGSATVLAAARRLAIVYCGALLLPTSLMFLLTPGDTNVILGVLGIVFFAVMAYASRITHHATMTALALNRTNQALIVDMDAERQRTDAANAELRIAQAALHETLETLEDRIALRTADLKHEICERERYSRELALLASRDSLTGLPNRTTLTDRLCRERLRAETADNSMAVLFLDLDKFKEVNDLKGHHRGDQVLCEVANRLMEIVPPDALLARWGGDEFVIVLSNLMEDAPQTANAIADRLRQSVGEPIGCGVEAVRVDATIGIALFPDHGETADELIRAADMAMYAAKETGRSRVRTFDPDLAAELRERRRLEDALRDAIANDELRLHFQPIVNATTLRCESLEALLRWERPLQGVISPVAFIPLAERNGQIIAIGRWVLEHACRAAMAWPGTPAPAVSLNVSVAQIIAGSLLDDVRFALAASGLDPRRLHLEVTETLFASDHRLIVPTLNALRAMGIRISLDDFGTGFSSLSYLRALPIDTIKIDKSFVDDIHNESGSIVKAIRALADAFAMNVVAEGVETVEAAETLRSLGVDHLQGYLFARPLPQPEVTAWLRDVDDSFIAPARSATKRSHPAAAQMVRTAGNFLHNQRYG